MVNKTEELLIVVDEENELETITKMRDKFSGRKIISIFQENLSRLFIELDNGYVIVVGVSGVGYFKLPDGEHLDFGRAFKTTKIPGAIMLDIAISIN